MPPLDLRGLRARLGMHLSAKAVVLLGLAVGICVPYFTLQRLSVFPRRQAGVTPLDHWIGFGPDWIYAYASIALLVPLFPLLASREEELLRYAKGLALLCGVSFLAFLVLPVAGPRPPLAPDHDLYRLIVSYDTPLNSLPSLHAGLTVYSLLFGYRVLRDGLGREGRMGYALFACAWGGAIVYATLATKQHWVVDIPAGILLAWGADRWAWRRPG